MRTPAWGFYFDKRGASIRAVGTGIAPGDVRRRLLPAEHSAGTAALMVVLSWPIDRLEGGRDASDEI
jgi:hypothetical protein